MGQELELDAALLQDYLTECDELLQHLDQDLVTLEGEPGNMDLLNRVFRAFHMIKGTSGFLGFTHIVELTHHAEDVLNVMRQGECKVTHQTMNVLLASLDQLREMLQDVRTGTSRTYNIAQLLEDLKNLLHPSGAEVGPEKDKPALEAASQTQKPPSTETTSEVKEESKQSLSAPRAPAASSVTHAPEVIAAKQVASGGQIAAAENRTIRVDVKKLDELINLVGELVLERNRLVHLSRAFAQQQMAADRFESALQQSTTRLSFVTEELQTAGLRTRMVSVDTVFRRFPRMVRDLAAALNKQAELVMRGEDTELDKTIIEEITDPLVHLLRNSLDHGIERPEVRTAAGKPPKGTVRVEARQEGDNIIIEIADDGAGIDPGRIAKKALEKGLISQEQLAAMSRQEILNLIFLPGLSTAEKVSDVSGRGVGMDVVRSNIKKLNGMVELESELGRGSCVRLRLPLTLAIFPVLLVSVSEETYALPLRSIVETIRIPASEIHRANGTDMLRLRDRMVPVCWLDQTLGLPRKQWEKEELLRVVLLAAGERRIGIVVDHLLGQEETVIKPLSTHLKDVPGLSGATISGNGEVRLILDPGGLITLVEELASGRS